MRDVVVAAAAAAAAGRDVAGHHYRLNGSKSSSVAHVHRPAWVTATSWGDRRSSEKFIAMSSIAL